MCYEQLFHQRRKCLRAWCVVMLVHSLDASACAGPSRKHGDVVILARGSVAGLLCSVFGPDNDPSAHPGIPSRNGFDNPMAHLDPRLLHAKAIDWGGCDPLTTTVAAAIPMIASSLAHPVTVLMDRVCAGRRPTRTTWAPTGWS